jgi:hypothetical protein
MFNRLQRRLFLLLLVLSAMPAAAWAKSLEIAPLHLPSRETATYRLQWVGITIGKARATWLENAKTYQGTFELQTAGITEVFSALKMAAMVSGTRSEKNGQVRYTPKAYLYRKQSSEDIGEVRMNYDGSGHVTHLSVAPPDDPNWRPKVSRAGMDGAYDPLTALLALLAGQAPFPLFDGRRLMQTHAPPGPLSAEETQAGLRALLLTRTPLEGHTPKELARMTRDRAVRGLWRAGQSRFPELLEVDSLIGSLRAERQYAPDAGR